jgi:hypothetical protein
MDLDKPMILPVFVENDTEETFKVKLGQLQKEKLEQEVYQGYGGDTPSFEPTVQVALAVPTKIWTAYANQDRLEEIGDSRKVFERLFTEYLIKNYYERHHEPKQPPQYDERSESTAH